MRIGILVDSLEESCQFEILQGIWKAQEALGLHYVVFIGEIQLQFHGIDIHYENISNQIRTSNLDGLIVFSGSISDSLRKKEMKSLYEKLPKVPIVNIGLDDGIHCSISIDNSDSMRELLSHLIVHHQFQRIAFVQGPLDHEEAAQRYKAYLETIEEHGLIPQENYVVQSLGNFSHTTGRRSVKILLDDRGIRPQAIVAADDSIALGIIEALQNRGISVPRDIAVVGFDDIPEASCSSVPLTTVRQPLMKIGQRAVDVIMELIYQREVKRNTIIPTGVVYRESCGCTPGFSRAAAMIPSDSEAGTLKEHLAQEIIRLISHGLPLASRETQLRLADFIDCLVYIDRNELAPLYVMVKELMEGFLRDGASLSFCQSFLSLCISHLLEHFTKDRVQLKILKFFQEIRLMGDESFIRIVNQSTIQHEKQMKNFHTISQILLSIYNLDELISLLYKALPMLNLQNCALVLYKERPHYSKDNDLILPDLSTLSLAYNLQEGTNLQAPLDFSTRDFLPKEWNKKLAGVRSIFMPLAFQDIHYGYILCSYTPKEPVIIYELLRNHITSAIHNSLMVDSINRASREKSDFLMNLSHEIKTPLTIISNSFTNYIKNHGISKDLQLIHEQMEELQSNVCNILLSGKLDEGQYPFQNSELLNLTNVVKRKIQFFSQRARQKNAPIESQIQDEVIVAMDSYALDCILNNLLDNALKYSTSGPISIKLYQDEAVIFQIHNNSAPIPEEKMKHLFQPFYQLSVGKSNLDGIGMGLHIVKKMVQGQGGSIQVESEEGQGTTFTVKLLAKSTSVQQNDCYIADPSLTVPSSLQLDPSIKEISNEPVDRSKKTILVLEDNLHMLFFLHSSLKDLYNVICYSDGQRALNDLDLLTDLDLVISDIMMEPMSGYAFLQEFYSFKENRKIPFLFLSARDSSSDRMKALSMGVVDFVSKPFILEELMQKIQNILMLAESQQDLFWEDLEHSLHDLIKRKRANRDEDNLVKVMDKLRSDYQLRDREVLIVRQIYKNKIHKQIAHEMQLSEQTIRNLSHRIYQKCLVNSKAELIELIHNQVLR